MKKNEANSSSRQNNRLKQEELRSERIRQLIRPMAAHEANTMQNKAKGKGGMGHSMVRAAAPVHVHTHTSQLLVWYMRALHTHKVCVCKREGCTSTCSRWWALIHCSLCLCHRVRSLIKKNEQQHKTTRQICQTYESMQLGLDCRRDDEPFRRWHRTAFPRRCQAQW